MTEAARVRLLFVAASTIFFTRAALYSTWQARGPEVQDLLHLNNAQMGLLATLYPVGVLMGLIYANYLAKRFGSTRVTIVGFAVGAASMAGLGLTISSGWLIPTCLLIVTLGAPMGVIDFLGNFEGAAVDRKSKHSLFPVIHAVFGVGMTLAAGIATVAVAFKVPLLVNYLFIALLALVPSIWAGLNFERRKLTIDSQEAKAEHRKISREVWREKRTLLIILIGVGFIVAETAGGTWVPIALAHSGYPAAEATGAYGVLWGGIMAGRAVGGLVVDRLGIARTVLVSGIMAVSGVVLFMFNDQLHLLYLALALWALGISNGFPLSINSFSDDTAHSAARINNIITGAFVVNLAMAPIIGLVGQVFGLSFAFVIPAALLVLGIALNKVLRPT